MYISLIDNWECIRCRLLSLLQAVRTLEAELQRFLSTYIILSGYLDDAATKIRDVWSSITSVVWYAELTLFIFCQAMLLQSVIFDRLCEGSCSLSFSLLSVNAVLLWNKWTTFVKLCVMCGIYLGNYGMTLDEWHVWLTYLCCLL